MALQLQHRGTGECLSAAHATLLVERATVEMLDVALRGSCYHMVGWPAGGKPWQIWSVHALMS